MKPILIFDNYDSFTYNIVQIVEELGAKTEVYRNDKIDIEEIDKYDKIILSPGPGIPSEAGILIDLIAKYAPTKSILGICLGEQAIGEVFGAELTNLSKVYHGVASQVDILAKDPIFNGLEDEIEVGRYHSWVVSKNNFPTDNLEITATERETGQIMAIRHKEYNVRGVQFHPESILTPTGRTILENWIKL